MVTSADRQLSRTKEPSGLGKLVTGILLGATKPRNKGHFGEENNFYFHPQLGRWVEHGKEDAYFATTELPPPPMTNHGLDQAASKRRSVAQRYKLQENLRVTGPADGHPAANRLFPQMAMLLPQLRHQQAEDDRFLHSGPPSASSECSSADSSGSPSARSSSSGLSLANGVHVALGDSSSSTSSSRAVSACGSTEDTASSHSQGVAVADDDNDLHVFMTLASPFSRVTGATSQPHKALPQPPLQQISYCGTKLLQLSQALDTESAKAAARGRCDGAAASSVSILCTVDSALLAAVPCQEQNIAGGTQLELAAATEQAAGSLPLQPSNSNTTPRDLESPPAAHGLDARAATFEFDAEADVGDQDFGGLSVFDGCAVLSRSSSLALSFADLVHPSDSLPEPEVETDSDVLVVLSKGDQQQLHSAAAHASDRVESLLSLGLGDVPSPLQDQQHQPHQAAREQGQGQVRADAFDDDDEGASFSFAPVFAKAPAAAVGVSDCADAVACRWVSCWEQGGSSVTRSSAPWSLGQLECSSAAHTHSKAIALAGAIAEPQASTQGSSAFEAARHGKDENDIDNSNGNGRATVSCGRSHSRAVVPQCGPVVISKTTPVVVDLTAVDSAVQLLKQLSGSLLSARANSGTPNSTAASKPHGYLVEGTAGSGGSSAVGAGAGPSSQRCSPPAAGVLAASFAQAAEKLASLGLLPTPPFKANAGPAKKPLCADAMLHPAARVAASGASCTATFPAGSAACVRQDGAAPPASAAAVALCGCVAGDVPPVVMRIDGMQAQQQQTVALHKQLSSPPSRAVAGASGCKALLRRMRADWGRVQEQVGNIVSDYAALGKQVAAVVAKQVVLERRCSEMQSSKAALARQLQQERQQREALEQQLELERVQRSMLMMEIQREREEREALEQQKLEHQRRCIDDKKDRVKNLQQAEGEAQCDAATLRMEMDELLLCLGQESTKVLLLAEALRAAGGDPEPLIEQVESEFVGKEVVVGSA